MELTDKLLNELVENRVEKKLVEIRKESDRRIKYLTEEISKLKSENDGLRSNALCVAYAYDKHCIPEIQKTIRDREGIVTELIKDRDNALSALEKLQKEHAEQGIVALDRNILNKRLRENVERVCDIHNDFVADVLSTSFMKHRIDTGVQLYINEEGRLQRDTIERKVIWKREW